MEIRWWEGQAWIESAVYAGPQDVLLVLAQREPLDWSQLSVQEVLAAAMQLLPALPLEARMELLVFVAHLVRFKAFSLLPTPTLPEEEPSPLSANGSSATPQSYKVLAEQWGAQIERESYRLPRGRFEDVSPEPPVVGLSQVRLLQAYKSLLERLRKRQSVHTPEPLPFSPEAVAQDIEGLFAEAAQWKLSDLWQQLRRDPLYRAMAFLWLLVWVHQQRLALQQQSVCEVWLTWQG